MTNSMDPETASRAVEEGHINTIWITSLQMVTNLGSRHSNETNKKTHQIPRTQLHVFTAVKARRQGQLLFSTGG